MHQVVILDHYVTLIAWAIGVSADAPHLLDLLESLFLLIEHILSIHGNAILIFLFNYNWIGLAHNFFLESCFRASFVGDHHQLTNSIDFFVRVLNYWLRIFLLFWRNWTLSSLDDWGFCGWATLVDVLKLRNLRRLLHCLLLLDCSIKL